jgi:GNAT superfamily N-acetyltransferase
MTPLAEATIELTDAPDPDDARRILQGLVELNRQFLGPNDLRRLAVLARAESRLVGGLLGETSRGLLFVELLWVEIERRRHGLGSRLLAAAESEARRRGCHTAWLDTFDFQARPFYERHGYRQFGELGGLPGGHRRHFMSKRLDGGSGNPA